MSFHEVNEPLERWRAEGRRAAVATLVGVRRSAPRPPGARFAASESGSVAGSVSSGCVEADLYEHIQQTIQSGASRLLEYGISDEMAASVGLPCGGEIDVLVSPYEPGAVWPALDLAIAERRAAVLVTGLAESLRGRQLLLFLQGARFGGLGRPELDDAAAEAVRPLFDTGGSPVLRLGEEALAVFAEPFLPPPRLAIVGATPVAAALCHLASYVGIAVTLIDPRKPFATEDAFRDAERILHLWPEQGFRDVRLDRYWSVVVLAHDAKLDVPALDAALRAGCLYVGQVGGRRTQRLRRDSLRERGFDDDGLDRIHGPVGLDIGAESPEEIALSILSELVAVRRGKQPTGRSRTGRDPTVTAPAPAAPAPATRENR